jgi:iron complex outermembrane receptor protein
VEQLRGPQGTLFGKNAIAGALNITTEAPTAKLEARGAVEFGNYAWKKETFTVSDALNDSGSLTFRVTGHDTDRNGFYQNATANQRWGDFHDYGVRAQLQYEPADDFKLRIIADYGKQKQRNVVQVFTGLITNLSNGLVLPRNFTQRAAAAGYTPLAIDPFARRTDENSEVHIRMEQGGVSAQADWTLDDYTLTSITAYRFWNWDPSNDVDLTSLSVMTQGRQANQERQFTQEFRITSPSGRSVEYTAGLYYFWEQDDGFGRSSYGKDAPIWLIGVNNPVYQAALNGYTITSRSIPRINSYAAYGQATWHVLPELDLTGGFRYTYEYKTGGFWQTVAGVDLSALTPAQQATAAAIRTNFGAPNAYSIHASNNLIGGLASATYHLTEDVNVYATYSHGEKSAGLNLANLSAAIPKVVDPETIDNYELGVKSTWFDGRLTANVDAFWADDSNYQTTIANLNVTPTVLYVANIPSVRSRGFEADITAQISEGFSTNFSTAYTDATYVSYPNAPAAFEDYFSPAAPTVFNSNAVRDLSGRPLPLVSKWVISIGAHYEHSLAPLGADGLTGYADANTNYRTDYYSAANLSIYSLSPAHDVTNLQVGVRTEDGHWDVSLWARNAFDTNYYITKGPAAFNSGAVAALLGDPRTFGLALRAKY